MIGEVALPFGLKQGGDCPYFDFSNFTDSVKLATLLPVSL